MNNLRNLVNVALPLVVALVVALSTVLLVAMMIPILVPVAVVGLIVLILWLWLRGNTQLHFFNKRKQRDYPEDFR
ncbi:MAG: hypothetical protein ACSHX8_07060 [Opitutaceae bacterium]